jgi:tetratricopeptide (TPR) repeat protein
MPMIVEFERDLGMGYYNWALVELSLGNSEAATSRLLDAIAGFERLADHVPQDLENCRRLAIARRMVGDVTAQSGDVDGAIPFYEQARDALADLTIRNPDVAEYRADLAGVRMNLGVQLQSSGSDTAALVEMESAAADLSKLVDSEATTPRYRRDLAVALRAAGELLMSQERGDEARTRLVESRALLGR